MNELIGRNTGAGVGGAVEESAEIANIQGKMILARNFPRIVDSCMDAIRVECKNISLAKSAIYEFPRGDSVVTGPSIRLAECVARHWGNIISGVKEICTVGKRSTMRAYCWDLQTNYADEKVFDVELVRVTKKGSYDLTDPRDRYEMMANQAARRKRACIQAVIPQFVFDDAIEQCQKTLSGSIKEDELPARREKMLAMFQALAGWITKEDLAGKCGKEFEKIGAREIVKLSSLYNAIKDGFVKPESAFGKTVVTSALGEKDADSLNELNDLANTSTGGTDDGTEQ